MRYSALVALACAAALFGLLAGCALADPAAATDRDTANRTTTAKPAVLSNAVMPTKPLPMSPRRKLIADECIAKNQACVLNGTPCCSPNECKGNFPNTTCQ
jgi:hypothetical protein